MKLEGFLPAGMAPETAIILMAGLAAFISVYLVWNVLLYRDPIGPRIKALQDRRAQMKADLLAPKRRKGGPVRGFSLMRQTVSRLKLSRLQKTNQSTAQRLATAGWRSKDAAIVFLFFKFAMPIVFAAVAALVLFVSGSYEMPMVAKVLLVLVIGGLGFFLPNIYVRNQATKRQHAMRKALPDGLDLMVICAEAGLSVDATFTRVSREMALGRRSSPTRSG